MKKSTMAFTLGTALSGLLSSMGPTQRPYRGRLFDPIAEPTVDERIARGRLLPVPGKISRGDSYAHSRRSHKRSQSVRRTVHSRC